MKQLNITNTKTLLRAQHCNLPAKRKVPITKQLIFFALSIFIFLNSSNAQGTWTPLTHTAPHYCAGVMILLTDGSVICKNSNGTGQGTGWDRLKPDATGSYVNGTWTSIASMHYDRLYFSAQVLPDGRLYVAGGEYGAGGDRSEVYDPVTNTWTLCPQIVFNNNISDANSEILPDGTVLQAVVDTGGTKLCYIWNPTTNTYAHTASTLRGDNEAMWVKLPDYSILFLDNYSTSSERYIPATHTWINDATAPDNLFDPFGEEAGAGFMLPDGRAYFIGSTPTSAYYTPSGTTSPGSWAAGPDVPGKGAPDAASAMMVNGQILQALSLTPVSGDNFPDSTYFFVFDYTTNTYTPITAPDGSAFWKQSSYITNMLDLPDGTVLFCNQGDDQYYEYTPGSSALSAGQPTISNIIEDACDSFTITGTLFNGITEGAGYGDDWQNSTNYPIVRLTSGANVYYAKTTFWNRIGAVMTGALPDTAQFRLTGVPNGTYNVQVIANGNPSSNFTLNVGPSPVVPSTPTVCPGASVTLTGSWGSGTWSSSNTAIGTIDPTLGIATGVASGSTTITYALGTCYSYATLTVNSSAGVINPLGGVSLCPGASLTLSDLTGGGTWSSSSTGIAAIGSGTGIVTAGSLGMTTISYTTSTCTATTTVNVVSPPASITGPTLACPGTTTTLNDVTSGGSWSSSNTGTATVGTGAGLVSGVASGTAIITYATGIGCYSLSTVTIDPLPNPITGTTTICTGSTGTLSETTTGGNWSSSNTAIATIGSSSALVTGISSGTATVSYTLPTGCYNTTVVTINSTPAGITGATTLCTGYTSTLNDVTGGGIWGSGSTTIATIGSTSGMVSGIAPGTAIITYYGASGCNSTTTVTINTAPMPITGITTFCSALTTTLSESVGGGTWMSSNITVATVGTGAGLVTGVGAGSATITYMVGAGCYVTAPINVNLSPAPITGASTQCVGFTTTLSDLVSGGTWTSSNIATATIVAGSGFLNAVAAGITTITYDMGNGCVATTPLTVNNPPGTISGASTLCTSATATLTDGISGGIWSSSDITIAGINSTSGVVTGVAAGSLTLTYTMGAGCYTTAQMNIISGPAPITGTTTICPGIPSSLSDATGSGTWSSSSTGIAVVGIGTGIVSGVTFGSATISYTISSGCYSTVVVSVAPPTGGSITGPASVCLGQNVNVTDVVPGGVWSISGVAHASIGSSSGIVTGVSTGVSTIDYTVTTSCGTAIATKTIGVNPVPSVAAIVGTSSLCVGGTATLTDATASGVWSSGATGIATIGSTGIVTGSTTGVAPISYSVTNTFGCTTSSVLSLSVADPVTPIITASGPTTFCTGGSVLLSATTGSGYTYQWQVGGTNISGATTSGLLVTTVSGNYTVLVNSGIGCNSISAPVSVTVNSSHIITPTFSINAVPGNIICQVSSPVAFTATSVSGGGTSPSYLWTVNGINAGAGNTFTYSPSNGDLVKCVLTSNDVCAFPDTAVASTTMTISPLQTPAVSITGNPGNYACAGSNIIFTANPVYGGSSPTYNWTLNGTNVATGAIYEIYTPATGGVVKVYMTSDYPCLATSGAISSPFTFSVDPVTANSVTIKVSESSIAFGATDTFTAVSTTGGLAPTYQWYISGSPVPGATNSVFITNALTGGEVVNCAFTSSEPCANPGTIFSGGITVSVGTSGISNINNGEGFAVSPNPNTGTFTITGELNNQSDNKVGIVILNLLGELVYQTSAVATNGHLEKQVSLAGTLPNGMYLINLTSGGNHSIFHVVVDR